MGEDLGYKQYFSRRKSSLYLIHFSRYPFYGSVLHMSIQYSITPALDKVVNATVAKGMVAVTSSGNWDANACNISPGRAKLAINVGAHGYKKIGCKKPIYADSNFGPCVDIIAPGVNVLSASHTNNTGFSILTLFEFQVSISNNGCMPFLNIYRDHCYVKSLYMYIRALQFRSLHDGSLSQKGRCLFVSYVFGAARIKQPSYDLVSSNNINFVKVINYTNSFEHVPIYFVNTSLQQVQYSNLEFQK